MIFVQTKKELDEEINFFLKNEEVISLVPTMGNLHKGHFSLIEIAKKNSTKVIVSIFINPLQFGINEDFDNYPRTIDKDIKELKKLNCDLLFFPKNKKEVFKNINNIKKIKSGELGKILCGQNRPGHFDGVLTVVHELFNLIKPNIAVFGKKDYQQQILIKKFAKMNFPKLKILTGSIIRDKNGLALSSRNAYLDKNQKKIASYFFKTLNNVTSLYLEGQNLDQIIKNIKRILIQKGIEIEYLEIRDTELNKVYNNKTKFKKVLLSSIKIGTTKLIDNIEFY